MISRNQRPSTYGEVLQWLPRFAQESKFECRTTHFQSCLCWRETTRLQDTIDPGCNPWIHGPSSLFALASKETLLSLSCIPELFFSSFPQAVATKKLLFPLKLRKRSLKITPLRVSTLSVDCLRTKFISYSPDRIFGSEPRALSSKIAEPQTIQGNPEIEKMVKRKHRIRSRNISQVFAIQSPWSLFGLVEVQARLSKHQEKKIISAGIFEKEKRNYRLSPERVK
jgi:hypothetical protein